MSSLVSQLLIIFWTLQIAIAYIVPRFYACIKWETQGKVCLFHVTWQKNPRHCFCSTHYLETVSKMSIVVQRTFEKLGI